MKAGRHLRGGAVALAATLTLAACAVALPQPDPEPEPPEPLPVLSTEQAGRVLAAVDEVLTTADAALDPAALPTRVEDPALTMRSAQYTLTQRSGGARPLGDITTDEQVLVIAASDSWPRSVLAVTPPPEGSATYLALVLRQDDPRSQYKLWGWVRLFPGVETPPMATPEAGSPELPPDAPGLVATPEETVAGYADFLVNGANSASASIFGTDPLAQSLAEGLATSRANLSGIADVGFAAEPVADQLVSFETAEGGAVVIGTIRTSTSYTKTLEGATLTLGSDIGQWLGDGNVPTAAAVTRDAVVAFSVPPAAEGAVVKVLGAEIVLVDASKQ